jgi:hypothetical protein
LNCSSLQLSDTNWVLPSYPYKVLKIIIQIWFSKLVLASSARSKPALFFTLLSLAKSQTQGHQSFKTHQETEIKPFQYNIELFSRDGVV